MCSKVGPAASDDCTDTPVVLTISVSASLRCYCLRWLSCIISLGKQVGPVILGTVSSPKVAEALFDLYLGDQPVSKTAKDAAAQTLQRLAASAAVQPGAARGSTGSLLQVQEGGAPQGRQQQLAGYYLPDSKGQEIHCEGQEGPVGGRRGRRKKGAAGGGSSRAAAVAAGLDVDDLDACVLHMG